MNKRGSALLAVLLLVLVVIIIIFIATKSYENFEGLGEVSSNLWISTQEVAIDWSEPLGQFLTYCFGINGERSPNVSAFIVLLATWLIFALAFADIMIGFGLFEYRSIGAIIGVLLTIVLANTGFYYQLMTGFMALFSFFAGFAVILSFISIFVAALLAHWGVSGVTAWLQERRNAMATRQGIEEVRHGIMAARAAGAEAAAATRRRRR